MKVLTAQQMREADRLSTERFGIPGLTLMENAGTACVDYLATAYAGLIGRRIMVLCGKGNNGGDGLVVARLLRERGAAPSVFLFAEHSAVRGDAATNLKRWRESGGELRVVTTTDQWQAARGILAQCDLVIDALLGTGLAGPVGGLIARVIEDVNTVAGDALGGPGLSRPLQVVSVDIPSGLSSDAEDRGGPVILADATVTFTAPKVGQLLNPRCDRVGRLVVRQIGTPPALLEDDPSLKLHWLEPGEFRDLPMVRPRDSNKGSFGHALIIAGSVGKSGAAAMAGRAALRSGAGLVTVATPLPALPVVAASMPELMTVPLIANDAGAAGPQNLDYGRLAELFSGKSVLAMGPGLTTHEDTQQFIRAVFAQAPLPIILDADGLNAFASRTELFASRKAPLLAVTPHPGEMARLLGVTAKDVQARRLQIALETAARWQAHVILKGSHTILATPDGHAYINATGNPGMATGGTGDVLTGILAGLSAEFGTAHWPQVLGLGIYLHGLGGDIAAARVGEAPLVASDLIEALPEAFARFIADWAQARSQSSVAAQSEKSRSA